MRKERGEADREKIEIKGGEAEEWQARERIRCGNKSKIEKGGERRGGERRKTIQENIGPEEKQVISEVVVI